MSPAGGHSSTQCQAAFPSTVSDDRLLYSLPQRKLPSPHKGNHPAGVPSQLRDKEGILGYTAMRWMPFSTGKPTRKGVFKLFIVLLLSLSARMEMLKPYFPPPGSQIPLGPGLGAPPRYTTCTKAGWSWVTWLSSDG